MTFNQLKWRIIMKWRQTFGQLRGGKQTCPRRIGEWGPWDHEKDLDWWEKRGPDRVCSFCGSIHPEDFEKFLDRVLVDDDCRVEPSDKGYKIYLDRPEIKNASEGAIKFYTQHAIDDQQWQMIVDNKYARALHLSRKRFQEMLDARRASLESKV